MHQRNFHVAKKLLEQKANPNALTKTIYNTDAPLIFKYIEDPESFKFLCANGADIHSKIFNTISILDYIFGNSELVKKYKFHPHLIDNLYDQKVSFNNAGWSKSPSSKDWIIKMGWWRMLEQAGESIVTTDDERRDIFMYKALRTKNKKDMKELLVKNNNIDLNQVGSFGDLWIYQAVVEGDMPMVMLLQSHGADPRLISPKSQESAYSRAVKNNDHQILQCFSSNTWQE